MRPVASLFLLALISASFAEDYVAINSNDGRDVLSGIFYANVKGLPVRFMPVPGGEPDIFAAKVGPNHDILLIQSPSPVSAFVQSALEGRNNTVEVYPSADAAKTNLELAKRSGAAGFIIVDSAYSDSALSVMPYAARSGYYVILADKNNIGEVEGIVAGKKIIIYGIVDAQVKEALAQYGPEVIGNGEDKFEDNLLIVERHMREFNSSAAIIVDGTFVEESLSGGDMPVIFTGKIVPQATYDFIKGKARSGALKSVLLIGNDLVVPIYDMREKMEKEFASEGLNLTFGITVKFAQVVPSAGTSVLVLDTFRMPAYRPELAIRSVEYNRETGKVLLAIENTGEGAAFYNVELRISSDGSEIAVLGGDEIRVIERGEQSGVEYPLDISSISEGNISYSLLVKYGSSKKSLEEFTRSSGPLATVSYTDKSDVEVQLARYDPARKSMLITIKNTGDGTAYAFSTLELFLGGVLTNISSTQTRQIAPGAIIVEEFPVEMGQSDLQDNHNVTVYVDYGGRPGFLTKSGQFSASLERPDEFPILIVLAVAILAIAAAAYLLLSKRGTRR